MTAPLLLLHGFLTAATIVIGKAAREGLAIAALSPAQMVALDAATFVAVLTAWAASVRFGSALSPIGAVVAGASLLAAGDLVLAAGFRNTSPAAHAIAAYIWLGGQASFAAAHTAVLMSRRLRAVGTPAAITRFGTAAIAGWIVAGFATRAMAGSVGVPPLIGLVAGLTLLSAAIELWASRRLAPADAQGGGARALAAGARRGRPTSRLLCLLAGLAVVSAAASSLATYQFRAAVSGSLGDAAAVAAFLGEFNVWAGGLALALQLLVAPLCRRLTPGANLMIGPLAIGAAAVALLVTGGLAAAVLLRGSDQVVRYSLDRTALERLYSRVRADQIDAGRSFIETSAIRFGDLLGTATALLIVLGLQIPATWLGLPILLLATGSVGLVAAMRARASSES